MESLATTVEVADRAALVELLQERLAPFFARVTPENVHVSYYTPDRRIGWDPNSIVTIDGYGAVGYVDAEPDGQALPPLR